MQNQSPQSVQELLPHLFRREYARMTAVLCRHFGLSHIEIAEDIASETFHAASEIWPEKGLPEKPEAWLYVVAKNKTLDFLRRTSTFGKKIRKVALSEDNQFSEPAIDFEEQTIADSQLSMIFAVSNPSVSPEAQICLALQILCGFSIDEIADAFLAKPEAIKKRLARARKTLRKEHFLIGPLTHEMVGDRLDVVLKTIYLLFNEGYFSKSGNQTIRRELCAEAIRLTLILAENPFVNVPGVNALLALFCYQSSRFGARENEQGEFVRFESQNPEDWDQELIDKGHRFLVDACTGDELSKYHLEAAIAYWHTTGHNQEKWPHILDLYNQLIVIEYSPVTALNRTFAFARVFGCDAGIKEAEKLALPESGDYQALLGYLYAGINQEKAVYHYSKAVGLVKSATEKKTISDELKRLKEENH